MDTNKDATSRTEDEDQIIDPDFDEEDREAQAHVEGYILDRRPVMTIAGWG